MLRYSNQKTAGKSWHDWQDCGQRTGPKWHRRGGMCFAPPFFSIRQPERNFHRNLAAARFAPTTAEKRGSRSIAVHSNTFRTRRGGRSLRASDRDASVAPEHVIHAKALGVMRSD